MSTFSETLHPRGQASNAGQFRAKANAGPSGTLTTDVRQNLDALRTEFDALQAQALSAESATWFAYALERFGDGGDSLYFDFEAEDHESGDRFHALFVPGEQVEDDSLLDAIPSTLGTGDGVVQYAAGEYTVEFGDRDGESVLISVDVGARRDHASMRELAAAATSERATIRDTAEQLAIAEAFERATDLSGADSATFRQSTVAGITALHCLESGMHIGAIDDTQARAFGFHGQGVQEVRVSRSGGDYVIERTVVTPISRQVEVLVDTVDGEPKRWSRGGL